MNRRARSRISSSTVPRALNALNSQVLAELDAALDAIDLDAVRCLIVRGAGEKSFVAGADIAQMKGLTKAEGESFGKQGNDVMRKLETCPSHQRGGRRLRARRRL